jgi:hypothetical protein
MPVTWLLISVELAVILYLEGPPSLLVLELLLQSLCYNWLLGSILFLGCLKVVLSVISDS